MSEEKEMFRVKTGEEFDESYLSKIYEIDKTVYEKRYWGVLENMVARYRAENRTFAVSEAAFAP